MEINNRAQALLDIFRQGLCAYSELQTEKNLGDRKAYIGMSDIAKFSGCPRSALANKIMEQDTSLSSILPLERGHWFEDGVKNAFRAFGLQPLSQVEINYTYNDVPIKAHLDLTLVWGRPKPSVRILEVKSQSQLKDEAYEAHELQLTGQASLLTHCWNDPVFSLKAGNIKNSLENLTFPNLCKNTLGVSLPNSVDQVEIEGWLLCLSMKEAQAFGSYTPNEEKLQNILAYGEEFWLLQKELEKEEITLKNIPYKSGYYPLCQFCSVNSDCPKFVNDSIQPQWDAALVKLDSIKQNRSILDKEIKEIENALKQAYSLSNQNGWIDTGGHRFRVANVAGRKNINRDVLRESLLDILSEVEVDALLAKSESVGTPTTRLTIQQIN